MQTCNQFVRMSNFGVAAADCANSNFCPLWLLLRAGVWRAEDTPYAHWLPQYLIPSCASFCVSIKLTFYLVRLWTSGMKRVIFCRRRAKCENVAFFAVLCISRARACELSAWSWRCAVIIIIICFDDLKNWIKNRLAPQRLSSARWCIHVINRFYDHCKW